MAIEKLCPPALIYLSFSLTQIILDTFKGLYNTAFLKFWVMIIFTLLLNILCSHGLGIISWIIVFVPFILMSVITTILLYVFGLNPETGTINVTNPNNKPPPPPPDARQQQQQQQQQQQTVTSATDQPSPNGSQQSTETNTN